MSLIKIIDQEDDEFHKPVIKHLNGRKEWYLNGERHWEDGPAVVHIHGTKLWYFNGILHNPHGPAAEFENGDKLWYYEGRPHREDGPASEYTNGYKIWYFNGKYHNLNGPAVEHPGGNKEWYLNNRKYTEEVFNFIIKRRRKIMFKYWLKWTDYIMNPNTERGKRYASKQFDKLYN